MNLNLMHWVNYLFETYPIASLIGLLIIVGIIYYILDVFVIPDDNK